MTIENALKTIISAFQEKYSHAQKVQQAHHILSWLLEKPASFLLTHTSDVLTKNQETALIELLNDHLNENKPLQYIFGSVPFLDLTIRVEKPILIPRPETEEMCQWIIKTIIHSNPSTILDLCTGTGCIALALAKHLPGSSVTALDINKQACDLAQKNADLNALSLTILQSDLFQSLEPSAKFDCIVSNPPYISTQEWQTLDSVVKDWEDPRALVAEEEGLGLIRKICMQAPLYLQEKHQNTFTPQLIIEIGHRQAKQVVDIFQSAGFTKVHSYKDAAGNDRWVAGML